MKATGYIVLGILVVLCFGLLVAFKSPAAPEPQSQNQTLVNALNTVNHDIDLTTALRYIANLKGGGVKTNLSATTAGNAKGLIGTRGGTFSRRAFDKILAQPGCIGIRFYYAQRDNGIPTLVVVGVNTVGVEMSSNVQEDPLPCPPNCD